MSVYSGNSIKSMHVSVEASLQKLRTNYIDILYVHWWDFVTSVEEVMNGLHNLVTQGKVLYLVRYFFQLTVTRILKSELQGISDTPAWVVSRANTYARAHGKTPFVIYQGAWNVMMRDLEREIIPMVRAEGMAIAPYNVLAAGKIRSDAEEQRRRESGEKGTFRHFLITLQNHLTLVSNHIRSHYAEPQLGTNSGREANMSRFGEGSPGGWSEEPHCCRHRLRHAEGPLRVPHRWRA